jgi:iron-sulfur cluster assembly protein
METTMTMPVTLTAGAIAEIKRLMAADGFDTTQRLRVGVKGGGCSGMSYILGFDHPALWINPTKCIYTAWKWTGRMD